MINIKNLLDLIGLDGTVFVTILAKIWQAFFGVIIILLVAKNLTPTEQGIYYTFASIIGLQAFVELGLSVVIIQFLSHESSKIQIYKDGIISGNIDAIQRIKSFFKLIFKWFGVAVLIIFILLIAIGFIFFSNSISSESEIDWILPWIYLVFSFSAYFFLNPFLSAFEGVGKVFDVAKLRLFQAILSSLLMIIAFETGFGLFAPAVSYFILFLLSFFWLLTSWRRNFIYSLFKFVIFSKNKVNWIKEIFPLQWRLALSWISGAFIFLLFNPVLFYYHGPIVAGQMGMTLAALNGITSLSMAWVSTKAHFFGKHISLREFSKLDSLFYKSLSQSIAAILILILIFILFLYLIEYYIPNYRIRLLDIDLIIKLSVISIINNIIFCMATYLRAHKKEPFLINSIVGGLLIGFSTIYFGKLYGASGMTNGYLVLSILGLVWALIVFINKKNEWHR